MAKQPMVSKNLSKI